MLDHGDRQEEAALLEEAYENLVSAYQEARELNDEMEAEWYSKGQGKKQKRPKKDRKKQKRPCTASA